MGPRRLRLPMQLKGLLLMRSFGLLVDLVYPPGCVVCGIATGRHNGLCPTCWSKMLFIERPNCEVLGIPFSHDLGSGILMLRRLPICRLSSGCGLPLFMTSRCASWCMV